MNNSEGVSIYYLSGTGNALCACRWIAAAASRGNRPARIRPIDRFYGRQLEHHGPEEMLGFAYPTHGFSLPWYMLKFMLLFPRGRNRVFLLNTRAGMKINSWHTPGISGLALLLPILVLTLKGYHIQGVLPLDMPSNWISLHPGLFPRAVNFIVQKCQQKVEAFSSALFQGKTYYPWHFWFCLPLDLALIPVALGYNLLGRFFLAKSFFASRACNNCGLCAECCPVEAIRIIDQRPYWTFRCESCMRCINICPQQAIECSHSFLALIIAASASMPTALWLNLFLARNGLSMGGTGFYALELLLTWLVTLAMMYFAYIMLFALLRHPWINRLFLYTSLTYYWARYKAPGIGIKDFRLPGSK